MQSIPTQGAGALRGEKTSGIGADSIREGFLAAGDPYAALDRRTVLADRIVTGASSDYLAPVFPTGLAVLAVGGFGRRELFPHSDIDVMVLIGSAPPTGVAREALSRFLQSIWDAGLRLSHSVHNVKECCELHDANIELNISLLDRRFLSGDHDLYQELSAKLPKFISDQHAPLSRNLCKLARQRHAKFHDTIYHLEPNIKETPGGIRDLHLMEWLHQMSGGGSQQRDLIDPARRFLFAVRCWLHYNAGRDNNLLTFDAQEEIARQHFFPFDDAARTMREYYRHARAIFRAGLREMEVVEGRGSSLLAGFRDWRSRLSNAEFTVSRERVLFKAPQHLEKDPELALRLFQLVARHKLGIHRESERRLQDHLPGLSEWLRQPRNLWGPLRELLLQPHASSALRAMHETGVLKAIFPEWESIECYVVRDFHHRYTVDEHTLITIENLEDLQGGKDAARQRFAGLLSEIADPAILKLALLFHDTGKGSDEGGHCLESANLAAAAASRIGMSEHSRTMLRFLIEHHLDLSAAMNGRDLDDPGTAVWLASRVETLENLKNLTLLTYCDIGAVNPTALTPWRLEQLWRVYLTAYRELTRELDTDRIAAASTGSPERMAFLKGFPMRYLRIHTDAEIDRHLALDDRRAQSGVAIEIEKTSGAYQLTLLTKDRLFLFASIAGALASFGMNILKAEAFANQQGTVLDTFSFADPQRTLELNPPEMDRLRMSLERVVLGKLDVKTLLKNRPKTTAPSKGSRIDGHVGFDNEASDAATLVEVIAQDRPGLLYDLASAFSEGGCNIEVVLVDTEAHKAIDVFYVTVAGRKLDHALQSRLGGLLLKVCGN
jgi:[protein-PII] uridylyltransferase